MERVQDPQQLTVPCSLLPNNGQSLPEITSQVVAELSNNGWSRIGLMVAFVDTSGDIMMLEHHKRDKNSQNVLGPLGETTQGNGPYIEQPLETLFRGISEELGIIYPSDLELYMHRANGWVINQWPRGDNYPGEYSCAISFPVFLGHGLRKHLESIPHGTEETGAIHFFAPNDILSLEDDDFRPGVKDWLEQLQRASLLDIPEASELKPVDFSYLFTAILKDIEL